MAYKIPDEILQQAKRCMFNYKCQEENCNFQMCEIERNIQDKALLIKKRAKDFCPYCSKYGYNEFCTCPVRIEIFKNIAIVH